jgi:hypothetical protein
MYARVLRPGSANYAKLISKWRIFTRGDIAEDHFKVKLNCDCEDPLGEQSLNNILTHSAFLNATSN